MFGLCFGLVLSRGYVYFWVCPIWAFVSYLEPHEGYQKDFFREIGIVPQELIPTKNSILFCACVFGAYLLRGVRMSPCSTLQGGLCEYQNQLFVSGLDLRLLVPKPFYGICIKSWNVADLKVPPGGM